ncbi:hypothetical protein LOK49_LG10G00723 [Camellia lanceoleosa]|uniref:Uncharacterized protein n=1 Tax=Camellia lanceoleosa TaxID=1840588 RepID=A0ACC0GCZ2_9ERIC|nr:hypothetical protein LOK49_LG10G00723 [Camellia lanceoleosa]
MRLVPVVAAVLMLFLDAFKTYKQLNWRLDDRLLKWIWQQYGFDIPSYKTSLTEQNWRLSKQIKGIVHKQNTNNSSRNRRYM